MKRRIGIIIALLGIFVIVIQPLNSITGAVIDLSTSFNKTNFFVGLILFAVGAFLTLIEQTKHKLF